MQTETTPREATLQDAIAITYIRMAEADMRAAQAVQPATTESKIAYLAALMQKEQVERLMADNLHCEGNVMHATTKTKTVKGNKYTKIDLKTSGRLMVENATGNVYGIKSYGQVHKGHCYGSLDTVAEWNWGGYYPVKTK